MRRLQHGGDVDYSTPLRFTFDGRVYSGFSGDTVASALLANGVSLVGRSFKYHRPRGIYTAGPEEPNALISVGKGVVRKPNLQATTVALQDGMVIESQNRFPSLAFDIQSANQLLGPLLGAGFYYKTFMGPVRGAWMAYEKLIRRAAGLGKPPEGVSPEEFKTVHDFCDVLVTGGGLAGLTAAIDAARNGAKVLLAERDFLLGGQALSTPSESTEREALAAACKALSSLPNVRVVKCCTVFGAYDHGVFGMVEETDMGLVLHIVRAERSVIATGAYERHIVFPGNDLPGVMLASAARTYLQRFGVLCGQSILLYSTNDSAFDAAFEFAKAGADVTLLDTRSVLDPDDETRLQAAGVDLRLGAIVTRANGGRKIASVDAQGLGFSDTFPCDSLFLSGGWSPVLHLTSHAGVKPAWSEPHGAFLPGNCSMFCVSVVGAAAGDYRSMPDTTVICDPTWRTPMKQVESIQHRKAFVDLQNDVSSKDVVQAQSEGFESVEHLKRYTTLGMGTDQGKLSNLPGLSLMAEITQQSIPDVGTTTFRPPFTPVSLGALAGEETGADFHLLRRSPLASAHREDGAVMTVSGLWERAWYYRENGDDVDAAYRREMEIVRNDAALCDVSTLGKIDIEGPDAAEFLNRIYTNGFKALPIGKARWGVMLRDDGYILDDGTTSRIAENCYFMTTTTANAGRVLSFLEHLLQTAWTDLKVYVTPVTDQWAAMVLAGPRSRDVLAKMTGAAAVSDENLPFLGVRDLTIAECAVRILRVSFSGEMSFEIYAGSGDGPKVWRALRDAGAKLFGLEALGALRIEKGHVAGNELDGRTTLSDLGLEKMASTKKPFIGSVLMNRPGLSEPGRHQLVGLESESGLPLGTGSVLAVDAFEGTGDGRITSATWSPELNRHIALALLKDGRSRHGTTVTVLNPARGIVTKARVRNPHFLDPEGERMRG